MYLYKWIRWVTVVMVPRVGLAVIILAGVGLITANTLFMPPAFTASARDVLPGEGVDFQQMDFALVGLEFPDSDWGRVSADPQALFASSGISDGFLNIFTDEGWVVQNLPVGLSDPDPMATYFTLGLSSSGDIGALSAHVEFSSDAQSSFGDGARSLFPVGGDEWNSAGADITLTPPIVGGVGGPLGVPGKGPAKNLPLPGGTDEKNMQPSDVNVEAAVNQCAPMAVANSLQYLEDKFGITVPNDHKKGLRGDNTLVGNLDKEMDRKIGKPTPNIDIFKGKFAYLSKNGLKDKLVIKHQGRGSAGPGQLPAGDISGSGITSTSQGNRVGFKWLCQQIKKGEDVEIAFAYEVKMLINGKLVDVPVAGHMVRVFECGTTKGMPWIKYLHDKVQGKDGGLEKVFTYVKDLDGDKNLNLGAESREVVLAISESKAP
jgi:hypothetical protein